MTFSPSLALSFAAFTAYTPYLVTYLVPVANPQLMAIVGPLTTLATYWYKSDKSLTEITASAQIATTITVGMASVYQIMPASYTALLIIANIVAIPVAMVFSSYILSNFYFKTIKK